MKYGISIGKIFSFKKKSKVHTFSMFLVVKKGQIGSFLIHFVWNKSIQSISLRLLLHLLRSSIINKNVWAFNITALDSVYSYSYTLSFYFSLHYTQFQVKHRLYKEHVFLESLDHHVIPHLTAYDVLSQQFYTETILMILLTVTLFYIIEAEKRFSCSIPKIAWNFFPKQKFHVIHVICCNVNFATFSQEWRSFLI